MAADRLYRLRGSPMAAVRWEGDRAALEALAPIRSAVDFHAPSGAISIELADRVQRLDPGGWLLQREDGTVIGVPADTFAALYEPAEPADLLPPGRLREIATALDRLEPFGIRVDGDGRWYVAQMVQLLADGRLRPLQGSGDTPYAALLDHWRLCTETPPESALRVFRIGLGPLSLRWNGEGWEEVPRRLPSTERKTA